MNIFVKNLVSVPFLNLLKANEEIVNSTIFSYAKKRNLQDAVTVFFFFSNCKVQLAPHVRVGCANLKDEDLAVMPSVHPNHLFYIRCIDNCRETVLKIIQVPQFSFCKNVKEQIRALVPSSILMYFASVKFVSNY